MSSQPLWMQCDPQVFSIEDGLMEQPDPKKFLENRLPFAIHHIDLATQTGVDISNGELIVVQGAEKNRKTTMVLNLVRFWCKFGVPGGGTILVETLESSMTRQKYKQSLIVMEATNYILEKVYGYDRNGAIDFPTMGDPVDRVADMAKIRQQIASELRVSIGFARVALRTPLQQEAIAHAIDIVNDWPLLIYGAASADGNTRSIRVNGLDFRDELPYVRWKFAIEQLGTRIIVVDHVQGYAGPGGMAYQMLDEITDRLATIVSEEKIVVVAVSQVSLGSMRDPSLGFYARGGKRLAEEANIVFSTHYNNRWDEMVIETTASRGEPPPAISQKMDMFSGKFIGRSAILPRGWRNDYLIDRV